MSSRNKSQIELQKLSVIPSAPNLANTVLGAGATIPVSTTDGVSAEINHELVGAGQFSTDKDVSAQNVRNLFTRDQFLKRKSQLGEIVVKGNYNPDFTDFQSPNKLTLLDKHGLELFNGCVVFGKLPSQTQAHYFNLGLNKLGEFEMVSCTYGYVHEVQPKHLQNFELIGAVHEYKHLLKCD